jgi:hypothetical protein
MRVGRIVWAFSLVSLLCFSVAAQQTATNSLGIVSLQQCLATLNGGQPLSDVTLFGTAHRIAGSDDETGTVTLKAISSGSSRIELDLPSGQRNEVQNLSATTPTGAWSGPDGISHAISYHNLLTEPSWFFPAFAIARRLSTTGYVITYVGHETHNGQAVEHVSISQTSSSQDSPGAPTFQHLTQVEFFLDSTTLVPSAISFNIHPDKNALIDIPVEVRFSDYRATNGAQISFHIEQYVNGTLTTDLQLTAVVLNSGLSASDLALQ